MAPMPPVQLPAHVSLINPADFDPEAVATEGTRSVLVLVVVVVFF